MQKNMGWWSVHSVTAMDIFKIQNAYVAQSAGALGSLKRKQNNLHSSWKLGSVGGKFSWENQGFFRRRKRGLTSSLRPQAYSHQSR